MRTRRNNQLNQSKEMVKLAVEALEEKKGEDVKIIDIEGVSVIADYFVLASASNANQTQALVDNVEEKLFKAGYECHQKEGSMSSTWVLMDYGDVIVHVFSKEDRLFYDLERIWRDGKIVESVDEL
nr:ribosome silencing factor [Clostridium sp. MCC328]